MDEKSKVNLSDNQNIVAEEEHGFEYWSNEFGISKDQLLAAAKAGKTSAQAVEKYVKEVEFAM